MPEQERIESFKDILTAHPRMDRNGESFARVLIKHGEHLVGTAIAQLVVNKVDAPDVVGVFRPQTDDGAVLVIEPFPLLVPLGELQSFLPPQSLDTLVVDLPAFHLHQLGDLAIAISAVLLGEADQRQPQAVLILRHFPVLMGRARQPHHTAGPSF